MSGTIEQLKELKELLDQGVLTQEEFDAQKKEILEKPKTTQVAPEPAIVAQPATMQPGMMQPGMMQCNAAGQMVDASGNIVVMDGGGRVWSAPYSKIMADEFDGCYCSWGLVPLWSAAKIISQGEDAYTESGVFMFWGIWPYWFKYLRIANTNTFKRERGHHTQKWSKSKKGAIKVVDNCPTLCCMHKC
mmetsp:Transcript_6758/g.21156  ORF Transcript_6758/g.21156 Transcript_6758/m.21156 type:complete len:189 (+) Transcript_6758:354-920(+)